MTTDRGGGGRGGDGGEGRGGGGGEGGGGTRLVLSTSNKRLRHAHTLQNDEKEEEEKDQQQQQQKRVQQQQMQKQKQVLSGVFLEEQEVQQHDEEGHLVGSFHKEQKQQQQQQHVAEMFDDVYRMQADTRSEESGREVIIQFVNPRGHTVGPQLALPLQTTREELEILLSRVLREEREEGQQQQQQSSDNDENEDLIAELESSSPIRRPFAFTLETDFPLHPHLQQREQSHSSTNSSSNRNSSSNTTGGIEIRETLWKAFEQAKAFASAERVLPLKYAPLAPFRIRPLTRCSSSLQGHSEAVLCVAFSPDGTRLASGSGDKTVRLWDLDTETPLHTLRGHSGWVLCIAWAPHGEILASAAMDGTVRLWDAETGEAMAGGGPLRGHKEPVTALAWQPLHLTSPPAPQAPSMAATSTSATTTTIPTNTTTTTTTTTTTAGANSEALSSSAVADKSHVVDRSASVAGVQKNTSTQSNQLRRDDTLPDLLLATGSKDATVRLWHSRTGACVCVFSGHTASITKVVWSGEAPGFLYTASRDTTIKVWSLERRTLLKDLKGHAHWVNSLAISTDASGGEKLLSASDDFTLIFWKNIGGKKGLVQVARMTGHQQLVIQAVRLLRLSAGVRLWDGQTGRYIGTLRGHVGPVYQLSWSADSRLLLSGSGDSTLKIWNVDTKKLKEELYGHADEVYAVDWSCSGSHAASGSKDKIVKIWRH